MYLNDAAYYVPDERLTIEEAGGLLGLSKENINIYKKIYGIESIPTAKGMGLVEFIKRPLQDLLVKNNVSMHHLKYLIHCHTSKMISPFDASLIQTVKKELGLEKTIAFGSSANNCASAVNIIDVLTQVLSKDNAECAVVICADYAFTQTLQLIPNISLLADGVSASLFSHQGERNKLLAVSTNIVGRYAKGMWLDAIESKHFEDSYIDLLAGVIQDVLSKAKITLEQVKMILPHNVNYPSWRKMAAVLKIPLKKIYLDNIKKYSHCFGADIFINYVCARNENILQPGDYYLMATVGLGATFAAMVFQY